MTMISQGAEANVYTTTFCGRACVLKRRMRKAYRHPTLDVALQTTRTISVCEKKKKKSNQSLVQSLVLPYFYFTNRKLDC
jgi:tRNA A-37 threonylcarbamoyl transferase component Bud32